MGDDIGSDSVKDVSHFLTIDEILSIEELHTAKIKTNATRTDVITHQLPSLILTIVLLTELPPVI